MHLPVKLVVGKALIGFETKSLMWNTTMKVDITGVVENWVATLPSALSVNETNVNSRGNNIYTASRVNTQLANEPNKRMLGFKNELIAQLSSLIHPDSNIQFKKLLIFH